MQWITAFFSFKKNLRQLLPQQFQPQQHPLLVGNLTCIKTEGGNAAPGSCCHFPFTYRQVTYTECTSVGHTTLWCYTNNVTLAWGECIPGKSYFILKQSIFRTTHFTLIFTTSTKYSCYGLVTNFGYGEISLCMLPKKYPNISNWTGIYFFSISVKALHF